MSGPAAQLIVAAGPLMLGLLREAVGRDLPQQAIRELARDLTRLTTPALHEALVAAELLPARSSRPGRRAPTPGTPVG
jgi:protein required for attachment to host cells